MARIKTVPRKTVRDSRGMKTLATKRVMASATPPAPKKKPHRYRPGTAALMEIRREQKSVNYRIPRARVYRTIRKFAQDIKPECRFKREALDAIHGMIETKLTELFTQCQILALHARRITVQESDVKTKRHLFSF